MMIDTPSCWLIGIGIAFDLFGCIGLVRLPDGRLFCTMRATTGSPYQAKGLGGYVGLGVEYPFTQKMSFSFDTRYHVWGGTDSAGVDGTFASVALSLLWMGRF